MTTNNQAPTPWTTASFGGTADTSPMELAALGEHLTLCKTPHSRLFALHCLAEVTHGFVSARFVSTLLVIGLVIAALSAAL